MAKYSPEQICRRKKQYLTRSAAMKYKKRVARIFPKTYTVYHCDICAQWHLTTQPRSQREAYANISEATS